MGQSFFQLISTYGLSIVIGIAIVVIFLVAIYYVISQRIKTAEKTLKYEYEYNEKKPK